MTANEPLNSLDMDATTAVTSVVAASPEALAAATAESQTPATARRRPKPRARWSRRLRKGSSRLLFTAYATALCLLFLAPFLYAVGQSLSTDAFQRPSQFGPGGTGVAGTQNTPWYPAAPRTYLCTDSALCSYQAVSYDWGGEIGPSGDPVDVSTTPFNVLPVYEVPGHGDLALLYANPEYPSVPADFIDPQTNTRLALTVDTATLQPAWDFKASFDTFDILISSGIFNTWLTNSAIISGVSAIGAVLSSVLVAYGFARFKFRGRSVLFLVVIGTLLVPYQVTMIPQYIIYHSFGWDATFLPLTVPAFFGNAYYIFLLRQFFMTLPRELDEAAMVDGAGHFRILTQIIVPQAWPAIAAVALFQFLFSWNDFMGPLIYLSSWPDLEPVSLGLFNLNSQGAPRVFLEAAAMISLAIPLALAMVAQRAFMRGIVISGVEN